MPRSPLVDAITFTGSEGTGRQVARIAAQRLVYAEDFKRRSSAGMVMVNLPAAGVDYHVPFGGNRGSSLGPREQGTYARQFVTRVKTT